jgi:Uma2 family endonuclease
MASHLPTPWTVDDFLEWEAQQPERYEFIDGMIVGVAVNSFETLRWQVHAATGSGASCAALTAAGVW